MDGLPIEIVNKIFLYVSSPTSDLMKRSRYYGKTFPFMALRNGDNYENPFPFPTAVEMDYRRIYRKVAENGYYDPNVDGKWRYRKFHEYSCTTDSLEDMDHDSRMECETDSEIIEKHLLYFIFHYRYYYDMHQRSITKTYDEYMDNRHLFERQPYLFRQTFLKYTSELQHPTTSHNESH